MQLRNLLLVSSLVLHTTSWGSGIGLDTVISVEYGPNAGYGQSGLPSVVLGVPRGRGGNQGSLDVLSLGIGGSIVLGFLDEIVVDGPGPDLIIFENPFFVGDDTNNVYVEAARVEFRDVGGEFVSYPFDFIPELTPLGNPEKFVGLAGVWPVYSCDGIPDPRDPSVAGGDPFDLATVDLQNASYVRITDCGSNTYDEDGDLVVDPGFDLLPKAGFDLDAVVAIHWTETQNPFRVVKAVATAPDTVVITLSKEPSWGGISAQHFSLNGTPLGDEDEVFPSGTNEITLVFSKSLEEPLPILSVSQALQSVQGENLLDRYEKELQPASSTSCPDFLSALMEHEEILFSAYPNPSRLSVTFWTSALAGAEITIWNSTGQLVRKLLPEGGEVVWDGCNEFGNRVPVGCYVSRLKQNEQESILKLIVLR